MARKASKLKATGIGDYTKWEEIQATNYPDDWNRIKNTFKPNTFNYDTAEKIKD